MSENKKVKILIACHKPADVFSDDVYTPIHVGRKVSTCTEQMADMIGDDTGDNISAKNPYYCELTAQYWAWKNLDAEYVGLCHYRRFFQTQITTENVDKILGDKYDALCVTPIHDKLSVALRLIRSSSHEDYQIFVYCLKKVSPEAYLYAKQFLRRGIVTAFNMFVMKKKLFNEFAEWQFSILAEMEKYVRLSGYSRTRRLYGYYAEMLLPIFLLWKKKKIKYDDFVPKMGEIASKRKFHRYKNIKADILNKLMHYGLEIDYDATIVGFKCDGIDVGYIEKEM